jgi:hypothetical protein
VRARVCACRDRIYSLEMTGDRIPPELAKMAEMQAKIMASFPLGFWELQEKTRRIIEQARLGLVNREPEPPIALPARRVRSGVMGL